MKVIIECETKEMADFMLALSQPVDIDTIMNTMADKIKDTINVVSHTVQE